MIKHYFRTKCPRCGKIDETCCEGHADPPVLKCGECLFNDVEIVALKVTPLRPELARNELAMKGAYARRTAAGRLAGGAHGKGEA
jgi:hypothetical protein